jgi:hypothetical protein
MKRISFIIVAMAMIIGVASCKKSKESQLIGMWGVERIEYYNIDYYGNPIDNTIVTWEYTPGDFDNGIELIFKENKQGEWRDHDQDTFFVKVSTNPVTYDTIVNPDTTVVTPFTYYYEESIPAVFVNTSVAETFMLKLERLDETTLIYTNEYQLNEEERGVLKRIDDSKSKNTRSASPKKNGYRSRRPGSFFSHESLNEQH